MYIQYSLDYFDTKDNLKTLRFPRGFMDVFSDRHQISFGSVSHTVYNNMHLISVCSDVTKLYLE